MPTKRARVRARKPAQGFCRALPGQRWVVGGLMAPGTIGEPRAGWENCPGSLRRPRSAPRPAARFSRSRGSQPAFPGRGLGGVSGPPAARPESGVRWSPAGRAPPRHLRAFSSLCSLLKGSRTLLFLETSPFFRLFYLHHAPSSEGQLSPLITGEGERNSSNTHFGTGKRTGGEGGLTREELGAARGGPDSWQGRRCPPGRGHLVTCLSSWLSSNC